MVPGYRRSRARAGGLPAKRSAARSPARNRSEELLRLQSTAGNQATSAAISAMAVQRAPGPTGGNTGGELELDGLGSIPLQTATWSIETKVTADRMGNTRDTELVPGKREPGNVVVTRKPDSSSSAIVDAMQVATGRRDDVERMNGTLRLSRPSRDGALPAATVALSDVVPVSYRPATDTHPLETIVLAVGDLAVSGSGRDGPASKSIGSLRFETRGGDPWPLLPVLSWDRDMRSETPTAVGGVGGVGIGHLRDVVRPGGIRAHARIFAGPALTRLQGAMAPNLVRISVMAFTPRKGGKEQQLFDVLIVKLASTSDGPDVVEVEFAAER
jgi:hypothetical protein